MIVGAHTRIVVVIWSGLEVGMVSVAVNAVNVDPAVIEKCAARAAVTLRMVIIVAHSRYTLIDLMAVEAQVVVGAVVRHGKARALIDLIGQVEVVKAIVAGKVIDLDLRGGHQGVGKVRGLAVVGRVGILMAQTATEGSQVAAALVIEMSMMIYQCHQRLRKACGYMYRGLIV